MVQNVLRKNDTCSITAYSTAQAFTILFPLRGPWTGDRWSLTTLFLQRISQHFYVFLLIPIANLQTVFLSLAAFAHYCSQNATKSTNWCGETQSQSQEGCRRGRKKDEAEADKQFLRTIQVTVTFSAVYFWECRYLYATTVSPPSLICPLARFATII